MNLAHRIELDTTVRQSKFLARACGVSRFTWNWALSECEKTFNETGKSANLADLKKRWNKEKPEWVYDSPKDANQQVFADLRSAYQRFFKKLGQRPKFKKKGKARDSFYLSNDKIQVESDRIRLPLIGWIRLKEVPRFDGKILSAAVSRSADRWFISVNYEIPESSNEAPDTVIGADLGVTHLATLSNGAKIENPKYLRKNLRRLKRAQRSLSRRKPGSKNRERQRRRVAGIHYRISNQRKDSLHKATTLIARSASTVVIEDLNVRGMVKNHNLALSISDCGFYEFRRQLEYKAKKVIVSDRFFPSSKLCHKCGTKNPDLKLSQRVWTCACGANHDRDINAALNLESLGRVTPEVTPVETGVPGRKSCSRSLKQEPSRAHKRAHLG